MLIDSELIKFKIEYTGEFKLELSVLRTTHFYSIFIIINYLFHFEHSNVIGRIPLERIYIFLLKDSISLVKLHSAFLVN